MHLHLWENGFNFSTPPAFAGQISMCGCGRRKQRPKMHSKYEDAAMPNVFRCPTVDELDRQLKITEKGRDDARNGIPARDASSLSLNEVLVRNHLVNQVLAENCKKAQDLLNQQCLERADMHVQSVDRIRGIPNQTEAKLSETEAQDESGLAASRYSLICAEADMNHFKAQNNLRREAAYPDSRIMHWVIIAAIVFGETVMNAGFFSQGMEQGLVGGMIAAFIITLVNVAAAFVLGTYCVSNIRHVNPKRKVFGWGSLLLYAVFLVWFSVAVGHYRSLIQVNEDALAAATQIMDVIFSFDLFVIEEFYGWLLIFFSFLIGVITSLKFYGADDPYPGYGEMDRRLKIRERRFNREKNQHSAAMNSFVNAQKEELFRLHREAETFVRSHEASLMRSEQLINEYNAFCQAVVSVFNGAVRRYRQSNIEVRPNQAEAPQYFVNQEVIEDSLIPKLDLLQYEQDLSERPDIERKIEELPSVYNDVISRLEAILSSLDGRFSAYMEKVGNLAIERYEAGNR